MEGRTVKMPWEDKTGLAKAAAFFASTLGVALGLCGGQIGIWYGLAALQARDGGLGDYLALPFLVLGYAELAVMGISVVVLLGIGLTYLVRRLHPRRHCFGAAVRLGDGNRRIWTNRLRKQR